MKITVSNRANLPNKYVRFIKWKIRNIKEKFEELLYLEVFISKEGNSVPTYKSVMKLGVPGHDIVLTNTSEDPKKLWSEAFENVQRYLRKHKKMNTEKLQQRPLR